MEYITKYVENAEVGQYLSDHKDCELLQIIPAARQIKDTKDGVEESVLVYLIVMRRWDTLEERKASDTDPKTFGPKIDNLPKIDSQ